MRKTIVGLFVIIFFISMLSACSRNPDYIKEGFQYYDSINSYIMNSYKGENYMDVLDDYANEIEDDYKAFVETYESSDVKEERELVETLEELRLAYWAMGIDFQLAETLDTSVNYSKTLAQKVVPVQMKLDEIFDEYELKSKETIIYALEENDRENNSKSNSKTVNNSSTEEDLFNMLEITNVSTSDNGTWYKIMGEITNNHSEVIDGYIEVAAYNDNGAVMETRSIALPLGGLKPNETFLFNESITKEPFVSYKFYNSTLSTK